MKKKAACLYCGWFFGWPALEKALKQCALVRIPLEKRVENPHVTLSFRPEALPDLPADPAVFDIIGYGCDGENEALQIRMTCGSEQARKAFASLKNPHITLSVSRNGQAKNSARLHWTPIQTLSGSDSIAIDGRFGYVPFGRQNQVIFL